MSAPETKRRRIQRPQDTTPSESGASFIDDDRLRTPKSEVVSGPSITDLAASRAALDCPAKCENGESRIEMHGKRRIGREKAGKENGTLHVARKDGLQTTAYTAEIYKSNIFKLQVDDLLEQVRSRHGKQQGAIDRLLRRLKTIIEEIHNRPPAPFFAAESALKQHNRIVVPFPRPLPPPSVKYKLEFAQPAHINTVGSYPLKTSTRGDGDPVVDIVVVMPSAIFEAKDYLNHRYFYKRAFYLACIASAIKSSSDDSLRCTFDFLHGNHLLPVLIVDNTKGKSNEESAANCRVVILPAISESLFESDKLFPFKNCIRSLGDTDGERANLSTATPFYNSSLRMDALITAYLKIQHDAMHRCDAYRDTCILGRIWLKQRGFSSRIQAGGFGNFEWAVLVALLLEAGGPRGLPAFSAGYSSYQLFKATLQYIASKDLATSPEVIGRNSFDFPEVVGAPVLFDAERKVNVLFKMSHWSWRLLQHEARTTLAALSDPIRDHFEATFINRTDTLLYRFDQLFELPVSAFLRGDFEDGAEERLRSRCEELYGVLVKGLSDRVRLISICLPRGQTWDISSRPTSIDASGKILVGMIIDPANADRTVDHGPLAEQKKEAAEFRTFWGEKAELRRFKDGRILESLVWSGKHDSTSIFRQVLAYILRRQFGTPVYESVKFIGDQQKKLLTSSETDCRPVAAQFQPFISAFQDLEKDIKALEGLPLQVRQLQAADPQLSYTSVKVPFAAGGSCVHVPAAAVLQFEGSARWPDDLAAIERTKMAFLLKLGQLLETSVDGLSVRVGLENLDSPLLNQAFADIVYPSGAAFRLRIHHDREATLIERRLKSKSLTAAERSETADALAAYKRDFLRQPAHTQAIRSLGTRFPAFPMTVRLMKKWLSSHLLSIHFAPSLIELFVARTFLDPYPWPAPSSSTTGFLRTLLFLARWDWRSEPWIVPLRGDGFGKDEMAAATTRFEAWRKIDPALNRVVIFACSDVDPEGNTWTDHARPAKVVAARLTQLAKAATKTVKEADQDPGLDLGKLFVSSLAGFHFVIYLDRTVANSAQQARHKQGDYKNLQLQLSTSFDYAIGYDPVALLVGELQQNYGDAMVLFHNPNGGDVIAGLWNPQMEQRSWKLKLPFSSMPITEKVGSEGGGEVEVQINKAAILNEIARLGGDLVSKIEVHTQH